MASTRWAKFSAPWYLHDGHKVQFTMYLHDGQSSVHHGIYTMGKVQCTMVSTRWAKFSAPWYLHDGQSSVHHGIYTMGKVQCTMVSTRWEVQCTMVSTRWAKAIHSLLAISRKFPSCCLWNCSMVGLTDY